MRAGRLAIGTPIPVYALDRAKRNEGEAAEELTMVYQLQSWGVPIEIADSELLRSGQGVIRKTIEDQVHQAVEQAMANLGSRWGSETIEQVRQQAIPNNLQNAETRTLHEALDAYSKHLEDTGSFSRPL